VSFYPLGKRKEEKGKMEIFEATKQALGMYGEEYASYIQGQLELRIEQGIRTIEETRLMSLGHLFIGNDGD